MRVAVTGADGFLGSRLAEYYAEKWEIVRAGHGQLELTEEEAAAGWMEAVKPDVVLHCAAISDTGVCERNPALSGQVNVLGTRFIARACKRAGVRLVMMSSDQVYTGVDSGEAAVPASSTSPAAAACPAAAVPAASLAPRASREEDAAPGNVYGRDKLRAEQEALAALPDAVCLRLPWMYDLPVRGKKINRNLLCSIFRALILDEPFRLPVHDYRGISYVWEVVRQMEQAVRLPGGAYNFGSGNVYSTYDTARQVLCMIAEGRQGLLLRDEERFASSPRNLTMDTSKLKAQGIVFTDTVQGFEACLADHPEFVSAFIGDDRNFRG